MANKLAFSLLQEEVQCPTSLSVVKDRSLTESPEEVDEIFDTPVDLSSDEEYFVEESRSARLKKSGKERIDNIKKAFSKENMQKTRQNFDKKVNRIRTRIVTPERRERLRQSGERLRQSGERLKQSGERFKKSISNAAPSREAFKMRSLRKTKDRASTTREACKPKQKVCSCNEDQVQPKKRRGSQMLEVTGHGVLFSYSPSAEKQVSQAHEMPEEVYVLCLPLLRG